MKINNLQILRFIASFMVLFSHVQHQALKFSSSGYVEFSPVYWAGGVDIFFVISGFIMYYISHDMFGKPGCSRDFFIRRLLRIVPPYWLFTSLMVLAALLFAHNISHPDMSMDTIICSYLFLPCVNSYGKFYPVLMLGWTLNFEFFFYIVFALGLFFKKKSGLLFVAFILISFTIFAFFNYGFVEFFSFYSNPIVIEFLFGILLAECYLRKIFIGFIGCILLVGVAVLSMILLAYFGISSHFWLYRFLWMGIPAVLLCAGFILYSSNESGDLFALKKFFGFLGDSSYSLYLSHPFSLNIVAVIYSKLSIRNITSYVLISMIFSILVSCYIFKYIELPLTKFLTRKLYQRM